MNKQTAILILGLLVPAHSAQAKKQHLRKICPFRPSSSSSSSDSELDRKILVKVTEIKRSVKELNEKLDCDLCEKVEATLEQTTEISEALGELEQSLECLQSTQVITEPGFVITERGVYCLADDLELDGGVGITIASDCVVLNLSGRTISGTDDPEEIGIKIEPGVHVVQIMNGFIENCGVGVQFGGDNKEMSFESIHCSFCGKGIVGIGDSPEDCHTFFITNCECIASQEEGCVIEKCGTFSISHSYFLDNQLDGLALRGCVDVGLNDLVAIDNHESVSIFECLFYYATIVLCQR